MFKIFLLGSYVILSFQLYATDSMVNYKIAMLCAEAESWIGVLEEGTNSGQLVEMFQRAVDNKAEKEPWCMSFVQYCIKMTEQKFPKIFHERTASISTIFRSEHCLTTWNKSPHLRIEKPLKGSLCIWQRYEGQKATASGHTGIIIEVHDDGGISVVEGNTNSGQAIESERDGVHLKRYNIGEVDHGALVLKGYLRVWL